MRFLAGVRAAAPVILGYVPIGFAAGVIGRGAGLSVAEVGLMSLLVFAGSAQMVGAGLFGAGAAGPAIVWTTFLINLRHLLLSTALVPSLRHLPAWHNAVLGHTLTDESFALMAGILQGRPTTARWVAGVQWSAYAAWFLATVAGAGAGHLLNPATVRALGLDFALPAMLIGLLVPQLSGTEPGTRWTVAAVAGAVGIGVALALPGNWNIILATVAGATVGVLRR